MRFPEKMTFSLPPSDASFMKVKAELIDESANEIILETEQLKVPLSLVRITICFLLYPGPLFASTFSMGKWHYRLDGWRIGPRKPWVFENLDLISENRLSVPKTIIDFFLPWVVTRSWTSESHLLMMITLWSVSWYLSFAGSTFRTKGNLRRRGRSVSFHNEPFFLSFSYLFSFHRATQSLQLKTNLLFLNQPSRV